MEHYEPPFFITNQMLMLVAEISEKTAFAQYTPHWQLRPTLFLWTKSKA